MARLSRKKKIRRLIFLLVVFALLVYGVVSGVRAVINWVSGSETESVSPQNSTSTAVKPAVPKIKELRRVELKPTLHNDVPYLSMLDVQKTAQLPLVVEYSPDDRTIQMTFGKNRYSMMLGATHISRNGIYLPLNASPIVDEASGDIWLPQSVWQLLFGLESKTEGNVESNPDDSDKEAVTTFAVMESLVPLEQQFGSPVFRETPQLDLKSTTAEQLIEYMSFVDSPVAGAKLSARDNHLPGAPRTYRNGTHEGLDYYADYTGIPIDRLTNVLSVADGIVVRVDSEYQEMSVDERNGLLDLAAQAPQTPVYILDKMRGRSVWVQYERGLLVRYAHLGSVHPDLRIGSKVARGQVLGTVGNSGTDQGALGLDGDLHLHMDMLLYGELFWQYLPKSDVRTVLANIF